MGNLGNDQCPNCGHRFNSKQMLFWGLSNTSRCPDCKVELGVNKDRVLLLWTIGVVAIIALRLNIELDSFWGWAVIAVFFAGFCVVATRLQKLEIKNKS